MDYYVYSLSEVLLKYSASKLSVQKLLERHQLTLDASLERYYGVFKNGGLVGGAGYSGNVIKCVAVDEEYRGEGIVNALISQIMTELHQQGAGTVFLYTKPGNKQLFEGAGFYEVAETGRVLLMQSGKTAFAEYLGGLSALRGEGKTGGIVMNCNPFTLGHQYLVETAAAGCDRLFLFVVEEDASEFPFEARIRLVREGVAHLPNVTVLPGGAYIISSATFPTYFIKEVSDMVTAHTELDLAIFGGHIAPAAGITVRIAGEEPYSEVTRIYNETMLRCLPPMGVEVKIVKRKEAGEEAISASRVRRLIAQGRLAETKELLPPSTYRYLASGEAQPVLRGIQAAQ